MKKNVLFLLPIFFLIILIINANATNNIYEFDNNDDMIFSTSVYKDSFPYDNATCNLTIFNPHPNENFINLSINLINKGNGIYIYDLTNLLSYNKNIYPITLFCNDSEGYLGADDRIGIKVGVKVYDFMIGGLILICIAFAFIYMSFKVTETLKSVKLLFLYMGLAVILTTLFYGLNVIQYIPNSEGLSLIFNIMIYLFCAIIVLLIYLQFTDKLENAVNMLLGSK